ncbi:MAG: hypothetical protein WCI74_03035 [Actinomycetes bacterium]
MTHCNRHRGIAGVALVLVAALTSVTGIAGCVTNTPNGNASNGTVWGYVASPSTAQVEVNTAKSSILSLIADRVKAPVDSWLVVYANDNGSLGKILGYSRVPEGESANQVVMFDDGASREVFLLMHVDKGKSGTFEFNPESKEESPDRPIFVDGRELARKVTLRDYGVKSTASQASIKVWRQGAITSTLTVGEVVAPADGWIVVHLDEKGKPGPVLGYTKVPAGRSVELTVGLSPHSETGGLWVVLHADKGQPGAFEFSAADEMGSIDQSFMVDGKEVLSKVPLFKPAGPS